MYQKVEQAFQSQNFVCIVLCDALDEYLVGRVEGYDQLGVLLFNIDYRGIATSHVYISMDDIEDIKEKTCYLDKLELLSDTAQNDKQYLNPVCWRELKKDFLKWIYDGQKKIEVTLEDEQFEGYIYKSSDNFTDVNIIDWETGLDEGHVIIRNECLYYFSAEI